MPFVLEFLLVEEKLFVVVSAYPCEISVFDLVGVGVDRSVPGGVDIFVDIAHHPLERLPFVLFLGEGFASKLLGLLLDLKIRPFEFLLEDPANFLEFLPVVDGVVLEGGEVDAGIVEGQGGDGRLFSPHWE